jgi:hypothetical protein
VNCGGHNKLQIFGLHLVGLVLGYARFKRDEVLAALDNDIPVKVRFSIHEISPVDVKQFRGQFSALRPHLLACKINVWEIDEKKPRVLVIEDFATKGLTGDPGSLDGGNFHSFWRRHGKSGKTGRAGGRWGLGKLVYSTSSDIRCFFGLTVQAGKTDPLLMGQAVLSNHEINSKKYVAHGFWFGSRNADGMQMPVNDKAFIDVFRKQVGITRTTQSGLSLAIPFFNDKITEEVIVRGVVGNYYFPILAGRLVVEVGSTVIDAKSFGTVAKKTMIGEKDIVSFLGDAENPAHTTWSGTAEKLTANWRSPGQVLKFLRYALWDLYTIVSDQGDRKDEDALIDFFSLEDPAKSESRKKGKNTGVPPDLTPKEKAFRIQKRGNGGFAIVPGPGVVNWEFPKSIRVNSLSSSATVSTAAP